MKKGIVFLLAFLYLASSCEATVYLHYCMGKAISFSFLPDHSTSCQKCGMKKSDKNRNCCKDEQKFIKSDKSQKLTDLSSLTIQAKKYITVISVYPEYSIVSPGYRKILSQSPSHGPPGIQPVPVYLMNRTLLI